MSGRIGRNGFTLLEVLISVAILAVSLLTLMNFLGQSLLSSGRAERISVSTLLARQKMAETLLTIEQGTLKGEFPDEKEENGTFEEQKFPDYFWKLTIKKVDLSLMGGSGESETEIANTALKLLTDQINRSSREVRLEVGWVDFGEEESALTVVTHIVNPQEGTF